MPWIVVNANLWIPAQLRSWLVRLFRKCHEIARFIARIDPKSL